MGWIPLGPTVVIDVRDGTYARMARANESGAQGAVLGIAVHPADEHNAVVVVRRVGGSTAFRTVDDGHSWRAIADDLTRAAPQLDLACAAVHPLLPDVVYLGARAGRRVFRSIDGGATWPLAIDPGAEVTQLVVDRASGADPTMATIYAATRAGVATSTTGGATWTMAAIGEVTSLAVYMPTSTTRRFFAGVYGKGLFYADAPGGPWTNLFGSAPGLPPVPAAGANLVVLVDYCARQPDRVYAMVAPLYADHRSPHDVRLFVSTGAPPTGAWQERGAGVQPPLDYTLEGVSFLVAPEPNGADTSDVLLCSAGIFLQRSIDGGRTWQLPDYQRLHHTDVRSLAHAPPKTAYHPDTLPAASPSPRARVFVGSDGGLATSRGYTNPAFAYTTPGTDTTYGSGATHPTSTDLVESLNHGLASIAAFQLAATSDPLAGAPTSMIAYATALDTGIARRIGSTAWTSVGGGDGGVAFTAPTGDGLRVWVNLSANIIWPVWNLHTYVDRDPGASTYIAHVTTPNAPSCGATSNAVPASPGDLYAGIIAMDQVATLASPVTPGTDVEVVPDVMTSDFVVGARVCLGDAGPGFVYQPISSVAADRFHVTIFGSATIPAGTAIRVGRSYAARITGASAARISQVFIPSARRFYRLARSGDALCAASADQRLWTCAGASAATSATTWTEVSARPAGLAATLDGPESLTGAGEYVSGVETQGASPLIASLTADAAGTFYVVLSQPVAATPLYRVEAGAWVAEPCTEPAGGAIASGVSIGKAVAHPTVAGRIYVARNARVFQLDRGTPWTWTDLTGELPGQEIHDLWIGNVANAGSAPRFVLRATTAVRGVWELELDVAATSGARFYFRDHAFDPGWLGASADGVRSPLDASQRAWHWQSADIKVDTPLRDTGGTLYYQNDPEAPSPTADDVAWFKDRSQIAAAATTARVWVRVNNRSTTPSGTVNVWAIACRWSGMLPSLPAMFWTRFQSTGAIDSALPSGGDWTSLGVVPVSGVHAEAPGVARFDLPTGAEGDHRCVVAFVHGPGALLDTAGLSLSVDDVVPRNRQITQRNVMVGPPLPAGPTPSPMQPGGDTGIGGRFGRELRAYIELNNPHVETAASTVSIDLAALPPQTIVETRLSKGAAPRAIEGAHPFAIRDGAWRWLALGVADVIDRVRTYLGVAAKPPGKRLPLAVRPLVARGGKSVELRELAIAGRGKAAAELRIRLDGTLEPGEYHIDLVQRAAAGDKRALIGGATIIIPVFAKKLAARPSPRDGDEWELERASAGDERPDRDEGRTT
ncbi:MAG TPA: hypothetical protein VL463_33450 [Kofleriaceae bacterium]|nr:hypothetical protein [Kofleriaceae bacterium]